VPLAKDLEPSQAAQAAQNGVETMLYDGDTFERNGRTFKVEFPYDEMNHEAPWDASDGHGPIREARAGYTGRPSKDPGEVVLTSNRGTYWIYNFAEAIRIAKRDGWNAKPYDVPGETNGQKAVKAVRADMEYLRRWLDDQWQWIGVVVTLLDEDGEETDRTASLWGIESDAREYLVEVAHELADEIYEPASRCEAAILAYN
jgi:hypothetical protein